MKPIFVAEHTQRLEYILVSWLPNACPLIRPEKGQGDLTSLATVACGEPLGCGMFRCLPNPEWAW